MGPSYLHFLHKSIKIWSGFGFPIATRPRARFGGSFEVRWGRRHCWRAADRQGYFLWKKMLLRNNRHVVQCVWQRLLFLCKLDFQTDCCTKYSLAADFMRLVSRLTFHYLPGARRFMQMREAKKKITYLCQNCLALTRLMNEVVSMDVSRVGKILGRIFSAAVTAYAVCFQLKLLLPYAQFGLTSGYLLF